MKSEIRELSKVQVNKKNPRTITQAKFQKLIVSLLSLPKMLEIRPIAVDSKGVALGGNMRLRAMQEIATMSEEDINAKLASSKDVQKKTAKEQEELRKYWADWLNKPVIPVVDASTLTKAEQKEFIIKDNGDFGAWDYDALANEWNADDLNNWGVDVWQNQSVDNVFGNNDQNGNPISPDAANILANEQDNDNPVDIQGNLPPELQGIDLNPNALPKIQGTDETPFERIIIVFKPEQKAELAGMLGLTDINKVVYHYTEIIGGEITPEETPETE